MTKASMSDIKEMKVGIRYPRLTVVSIVYKNNRDVATLVNLFSERFTRQEA
jgi:hypothetical protein